MIFLFLWWAEKDLNFSILYIIQFIRLYIIVIYRNLLVRMIVPAVFQMPL